MTRLRFWLPLALSMLPASRLAAQPAGAPIGVSAASGEGRACFRPAPMPNCRAFWITEFGYSREVTPPRVVMDTLPPYSSSGPDSIVRVPPQPFERRLNASFLTWELGHMVNRGDGTALGASIFIGASTNNFDRSQLGIRGRHRWWNLHGMRADVGPGVYVSRDEQRIVDHGVVKTLWGVSAQGSLILPSDLVGLTTTVDITREHVGVQLGGRFGSTLGAGLMVAVPVVVFFGIMLGPA